MGQAGQMDAPDFYPETQLILSAEGIFRGQKKTTFVIGFHRILLVFAKKHTKQMLGALGQRKKNKNQKSFHFQHPLVTNT